MTSLQRKERSTCRQWEIHTTNSFHRSSEERRCISNVERSRFIKFRIWKNWVLEACLNLLEITQILTSFMSDINYLKLPNREWLWNLLNTILGERFREFIQSKQQERTEYITEKKEMKVIALPEFIKLIKDSKSISTQKGRSHF